MVLFKIAIGQMSSGSCVKCFSEIPADSLFIKLVDFVQKEMGCNFLATKIKRWFNDNGGKYEKEFVFRFRGKESFLYMKHFPSLVKMLFINVTNKAIKKWLIEVDLQSVYLRKLLSYTVHITDFSLEDLNLMKKTTKDLFKMRCMFDSKISPSLWTVCNASPFHVEMCLTIYGFGLGCNTMEGREQKHETIAKYSENTAPQNRWSMIFWHEYLQLIYLRLNGYDDVKYRKKTTSYIPTVDKSLSCRICRAMIDSGIKCLLCNDPLMLQAMKVFDAP